VLIEVQTEDDAPLHQRCWSSTKILTYPKITWHIIW